MRPFRTVESSKGAIRKQSIVLDLWNSKPAVCFAVVSALWVLLCYWPVLSAPFVYDDVIAIQKNPALSSWRSILVYFHTPVPLSNEYRGYGGLIYRPLVWLSYIVDRHVWGLYAGGFHATNLFLHWSCGLAGFFLLQALRVRPIISALVCLIWLGLPINSEAVTWISGRSTDQVVLFILLSLVFAVQYQRSRTPLWLIAYGATSLASLLSNEWGVLTFPLTVAVLALDVYKNRQVWLALSSAGFGAIAIYAGLRIATKAQLPIGPVAFLPVGIAFFKYIGWILLPVKMSVERSSDTPSNTFSAQSLSGLIALVLFCAVVLKARKRLPKVAAGLTWLLIGLLPFSGIVHIYQGMAERYVYLASSGLIFAIVVLAFRLQNWPKKIAALVITVWLVWGFFRLQQRVEKWRSEDALYEDSLRATPRSPILLFNLAVLFADTGRLTEAADYYERTLDVRPRDMSALVNLGSLLTKQGEYAKALPVLERATAIQPQDPDPIVNIGNIYLQIGSVQRARHEYDEALALNPMHFEANVNLGTALQDLGDLSGAARQYQKAISIDPQQGAPYCNLGVVLFKQGKLDAAIQTLKAGITNNPSYAPAFFNLGVLYQQTRQPELAAQMYRRALQIDPDYEKARRNLDLMATQQSVH